MSRGRVRVIPRGVKSHTSRGYKAELTGGVERDPNPRYPTLVQVVDVLGKEWVPIDFIEPVDADAGAFMAAVRLDPKAMEDAAQKKFRSG